MAQFVDANGQSWEVSIDGIALGELRDRGIDIVQDGLFFVEQREDVLLKALLLMCRDQIAERKLTDRQFSKLVTGTVVERATEAVRGAAEDFFPASRWSEIRSRSQKREEADTTFREIAPMLELLNRPQMPPTMRQAVLDAIGAKLEDATNSAK